jgi:hypothetical protein
MHLFCSVICKETNFLAQIHIKKKKIKLHVERLLAKTINKGILIHVKTQQSTLHTIFLFVQVAE